MIRVAIPGEDCTHLIKHLQIICMQGSGNYTTIYIKDESQPKGYTTLHSSYNLKQYELQTAHLPFKRVCKNYIIGLDYVVGLNKDNTVSLKPDCCGNIPVSKEYCPDLEAILIAKGYL